MSSRPCQFKVVKDEYRGQHTELKKVILGWLKFYASVFELRGWRIFVRWAPLSKEDYDKEDLEDGKIPTEWQRRLAGGIATEPEYRRAEFSADLEVMSHVAPKKSNELVRHELLHVMLVRMQLLNDMWAVGDDDDEEHARQALETTTVNFEDLDVWKIVEKTAPKWLRNL